MAIVLFFLCQVPFQALELDASLNSQGDWQLGMEAESPPFWGSTLDSWVLQEGRLTQDEWEDPTWGLAYGGLALGILTMEGEGRFAFHGPSAMQSLAGESASIMAVPVYLSGAPTTSPTTRGVVFSPGDTGGFQCFAFERRDNLGLSSACGAGYLLGVPSGTFGGLMVLASTRTEADTETDDWWNEAGDLPEGLMRAASLDLRLVDPDSLALRASLNLGLTREDSLAPGGWASLDYQGSATYLPFDFRISASWVAPDWRGLDGALPDLVNAAQAHARLPLPGFFYLGILGGWERERTQGRGSIRGKLSLENNAGGQSLALALHGAQGLDDPAPGRSTGPLFSGSARWALEAGPWKPGLSGKFSCQDTTGIQGQLGLSLGLDLETWKTGADLTLGLGAGPAVLEGNLAISWMDVLSLGAGFRDLPLVSSAEEDRFTWTWKITLSLGFQDSVPEHAE